MPDRPLVSDASEALYAELGPTFTEERDPEWQLLDFCGALGVLLDPLWAVLHDEDDRYPWGALFNVNDCPAWGLKYLGQFVGVVVQPAWSEADTRAAIAEPVGIGRGRVSAMVTAAQTTLTGSKNVAVYEQDSSGYHMSIRTKLEETPDEALTAAAILSMKPAGIVLDFQAIEGQTYSDLDSTYATYSAVDSAYADYAEMSADVP